MDDSNYVCEKCGKPIGRQLVDGWRIRPLRWADVQVVHYMRDGD